MMKLEGLGGGLEDGIRSIALMDVLTKGSLSSCCSTRSIDAQDTGMRRRGEHGD